MIKNFPLLRCIIYVTLGLVISSGGHLAYASSETLHITPAALGVILLKRSSSLSVSALIIAVPGARAYLNSRIPPHLCNFMPVSSKNIFKARYP